MPASPVIGEAVCALKKADFTPAAPRVGATKRGRIAVQFSVVLIFMSHLLRECQEPLRLVGRVKGTVRRATLGAQTIYWRVREILVDGRSRPERNGGFQPQPMM